MYPINIDFWFIQVRGYEGHWALGILIMGFFYQKYKSLKSGYEKEWFVSAYTFAIFTGFIFARLFHYFFWETDEFLKNPLIVFNPSGGFAILGGTIGTGFGGWLYCQFTKKNFLHWCDSLMTPLTLGLCLSRFSCFLNGDAYGNPTDSIFGVVFSENSDDWMQRWNSLHGLYAYSEKPLNIISNLFAGQVNLSSIPLPNVLEPLRSEGITNLAQLSKFYPPAATGDYMKILHEKALYPFPVIYPPVHPAQLYEVFVLGIGFFTLFKLEDVKWAERKLFFIFWIIYGINRFIIEIFRGDRNLFIGDLTYAQVISLFLCLGGIVGILFFTWKWNKYGMPEVNPKA
ncbi:prolipoprotein diacylglyceryl transferase [Leptospira sp. GIMC2001]|uniref:prolipoprotein diacylglyceryl transferase n=1 Tax=Leptospira sp. GIMC2001 TaxID=1513297 RepID=UPI00234AE0A3|nr:prolipoprotein diacylglyceryl transferase family protein [Leptospira sp. GIMC2001]WCL49547.1 prolipoprotein diacylglyceryl transferase [Leptospira sp. GIMC2001]